jgi:hypothetical protein
MLCIAWLVVMNRAEASAADPTRGVHRPKACPVLSPPVAVSTPRVVHISRPPGSFPPPPLASAIHPHRV